ncbi:MAG: hypothetical protein JWO40_697 [Candidatus Doudnabacteria bacterium]|nr:hypothetical protein [Candidatus Doudnabacteria bacterium]
MNLFAILVAATGAFIIAFLWNGPIFGKLAMRLANTPPNANPPKVSQIILNYLVFLVTAFVMSRVFQLAFASSLMGERTWYHGVVIAILLWLGFIVTSTSVEVIWKGRSWKLWLFECAASFVAFAFMGSILAIL